MLRVLTYHRIAETDKSPDLHPGLISATPRMFEQHMQYLKTNYVVVSMEEVLFCLHKHRPAAPRSVLLTFDDAYRDFLDNAWPILSRYQLPATLFVPTAYPDHPERSFWWDKLYRAVKYASAEKLRGTLLRMGLRGTPNGRPPSLTEIQEWLKTLPFRDAMAVVDRLAGDIETGRTDSASVLTWDELRKLSEQGVTLGAHTVTHPILTRITPEQAREEIHRSYRDLQQRAGSVLPIFSYPNGNFNDSILAILRDEKFEAAFTTLNGHNDLSTADPLRLRRTNISARTTKAVLRLRLSRWISGLDSWRRSKGEGANSRRLSCMLQH